jgi:hypothetical protein
MITNPTCAQKLEDKAKFTSAEGYTSDQSGKPAHWGERTASFVIPNAGLPCCSGELGFTD